jgi:hypothetical protein
MRGVDEVSGSHAELCGTLIGSKFGAAALSGGAAAEISVRSSSA